MHPPPLPPPPPVFSTSMIARLQHWSSSGGSRCGNTPARPIVIVCACVDLEDMDHAKPTCITERVAAEASRRRSATFRRIHASALLGCPGIGESKSVGGTRAQNDAGPQWTQPHAPRTSSNIRTSIRRGPRRRREHFIDERSFYIIYTMNTAQTYLRQTPRHEQP